MINYQQSKGCNHKTQNETGLNNLRTGFLGKSCIWTWITPNKIKHTHPASVPHFIKTQTSKSNIPIGS